MPRRRSNLGRRTRRVEAARRLIANQTEEEKASALKRIRERRAQIRAEETAERRAVRLENARRSRSALLDLQRERNRLRMSERRQREKAETGVRVQQSRDYNCLGLRYNSADDSSLSRHVLIDTRTEVCPHSKALKFNGETKGMCCAAGKIKLNNTKYCILTSIVPCLDDPEGEEPITNRLLDSELDSNASSSKTKRKPRILKRKRLSKSNPVSSEHDNIIDNPDQVSQINQCADYSDDDEYDAFGKLVAIQLRQLPLYNALICQEKIQTLIKEHRLQSSSVLSEEIMQTEIKQEPPTSPPRLNFIDIKTEKFSDTESITDEFA